MAAKEAAKKKELDDRIAKDIEAARQTKGYGDVCKPLEMTQDGKPMCGSCKAVEGGKGAYATIIHYFGCPCNKKGGKRTRTKKSKRHTKSRSKKARKTRRRV